MMTEPLRLQETLQRALSEQAVTHPSFSPSVAEPEHAIPEVAVDTERMQAGDTASSASRPLFAVSAALAATAVSVAFNAPAVLLASVAGIAVYAAAPLFRRASSGSTSQISGRQTRPASTDLEHEFDRKWELGEFSSQLASVFDSLGDMVAVCGSNGQMIFANETFKSATGFGNPVGLTLSMTGIEPLDTTNTGALELVLGDGDEQTIWTWHETVTRDPATGELVLQCIGRNITSARLTEAELVEARQKAEAANHAKSRFLATVSHEIRTPLNGILGMTHLLEQTQTTPEQASYLKTAGESGMALLSLIEDLLDVTSIEAGRLHLRHEEGNLEDLVNGVSELMASRAHEKGIEIAVHIAPEAPRLITSDIGRLRQVLFNLVGNAIKFTETGGVLIEVVREDMQLAFIVSDTGPGLKQADQARIFEEFERASNGSISARIVEALGGEIGVTSTAGKGSSFRFTVPVRELAVPETIAPVRGPLADRAVLVIAPSGPVSTALLWTIRDLGGIAEAAHDPDSMIAIRH